MKKTLFCGLCVVVLFLLSNCGAGKGCKSDADCGATTCVEGLCTAPIVAMPVITWVSPILGKDRVRPDVALKVSLDPAGGVVPDQLTLTIKKPGSTDARTEVMLKQPDGNYLSPALGLTGGPWAVTVNWTEHQSLIATLTRTILVDVVPPDVQIALPPVPTRGSTGALVTEDSNSMFRGFRRDETIHAKVTWTDEADADPTTLKVVVHKAGQPDIEYRPTGPCSECSGSANCACVNIDMWKPLLNAFHANDFEASASLSDLTGNQGTSPASTFAITRFKWSRDLKIAGSDATFTATSPAVNANGFVIFGLTLSSTAATGKLASLSPAGIWLTPDGNVGSGGDTGGRSQAPVVGKDFVYLGYVAPNTPTTADIVHAYISRFDPMTLQSKDPIDSACGIKLSHSSVGAVESPLTLLTSGREVVTAILMSDSFLGYNRTYVRSLIAAGASESGHLQCLSQSALPDLDYSNVSKGVTNYFAPSIPRGAGYVQQMTFSDGIRSLPALQTFASDGRNGVQLKHGITALSFTEHSLIAAGPFGSSMSGMNTFDIANPPTEWSLNTPASPRQVVVRKKSDNTELLFWNDGSKTIFRQTFRDSTSEHIVSAVLADKVRSAPVLGAETPDVAPLMYVIDEGGALNVFDDNLVKVWAADTGTFGAIAPTMIPTHPSIDVFRNHDGSKDCTKPGTLYFTNPTTGFLTALIVDSHGIDPKAPWAKYQHDPANTGNADYATDAWSCPNSGI